jgi:Flp pilus assembly protein TadG
MLALAITTICGLLALAVDIGLAYTIRKSAQSAADAAALAGAQQAFTAAGWSAFATQIETEVDAGQSASATCPSSVECQASRNCGNANSPPTNIDGACQYALNNGFSTGSNNGYTQIVSVVASGINSPGSYGYAVGLTFQQPGPAVSAYYWVQVGISESIPYIFGRLVKNSTLLTVKVQSVAAIVVTDDGAGAITSTVSLVQ